MFYNHIREEHYDFRALTWISQLSLEIAEANKPNKHRNLRSNTDSMTALFPSLYAITLGHQIDGLSFFHSRNHTEHNWRLSGLMNKSTPWSIKCCERFIYTVVAFKWAVQCFFVTLTLAFTVSSPPFLRPCEINCRWISTSWQCSPVVLFGCNIP